MFSTFFKDSFTPPSVTDCNSANCRKRIEFVDLAKGICIILVILNHYDNVFFFVPNFQALRMPLYFVLSGLFFKDYTPTAFVTKKINNILIPFAFWLGLAVIWGMLFEDISISAIYDWAYMHNIYLNFVLWFLICLFLTNIIFYSLQKILHGLSLTVGVLAVAAIGVFLGQSEVRLLAWLDTACTGLPFFYLGYSLKSFFLNCNYSKFRILAYAAACLVSAYIIYFAFNNPHISFVRNLIYGHPVLIYINSALMVTGTLMLCMLIKWLPIVSYIGRYSIIPLCVHIPILKMLYALPEMGIEPHVQIAVILVLLLLCCWIAIPICKKYLGYFTAQRPLIYLPESSKSSVQYRKAA